MTNTPVKVLSLTADELYQLQRALSDRLRDTKKARSNTANELSSSNKRRTNILAVYDENIAVCELLLDKLNTL